MLRMEAEQQAVLTSMGEELDAACHSLARNGEDKLQVFFINMILNVNVISCSLCVFKAAFSCNEADMAIFYMVPF